MKTKITMQMSSKLSIQECYEKYIKKCNIRNLSSKTICVYKNHYKILSEFIDVNSPIADITSDVIDDFIIFVKESHNCNDISINSLLRSIRAFIYHSMDNGSISPRFTFHLLRTEKKIKPTYTTEELSLLLKKPNKDKCSFTNFRLWVFSNYLLGTGNRISSALDLQICDLDMDNSLIHIRNTKSRKSQLIPLSKTPESVLAEYLAIRGGEATDYIFCNSLGEKGNIRVY